MILKGKIYCEILYLGYCFSFLTGLGVPTFYGWCWSESSRLAICTHAVQSTLFPKDLKRGVSHSYNRYVTTQTVIQAQVELLLCRKWMLTCLYHIFSLFSPISLDDCCFSIHLTLPIISSIYKPLREMRDLYLTNQKDLLFVMDFSNFLWH